MVFEKTIFNLDINHAVEMVVTRVGFNQSQVLNIEAAAKIKRDFDVRIIVFGHQALFEQFNFGIFQP